ncbi:MAG: hypothetical protein ACWA42_03815 [Lutibacter sp.]
MLMFITKGFAQVSSCEELGLRPITSDGYDVLKIYYDGNGSGVGGHGCWVHHHPNGKDFVITPHSWTIQPNDYRQTLIKNAMQAITDSRVEYVKYGTLNNHLYYILNDVHYYGYDGETFWLAGDKCIMRSGVPNLKNESNEYKRFVYAHEVGHCFVMENVPELKNQYDDLNHWFDESVAEFLASEVYKELNAEYDFSREFDFDGHTYRQPYNAYVLWYYLAMKKGEASVVALMNALAETPNLNSRLAYLRAISFDSFFQSFLFNFLIHKIPDSGTGNPIPRKAIAHGQQIQLDPNNHQISLNNIAWGKANIFKLSIPAGYDLSINPSTGSSLKYYQSLREKISGVSIENWTQQTEIKGDCSSEVPVFVIISHLNPENISDLSINYTLQQKSNCCLGFSNQKCLAKLEDKPTIKANSNVVNDFFKFDYKITANLKFKSGGTTKRIKNLSYYVNTQDGSIYFPKESIKEFSNGRLANQNGRVDGAIWLSNHQLVIYLYDAIFKRKRAFTVSSKKSSDDVFMNEHLGFLQFFNDQADTINVLRPEPLPQTSKWQGVSQGYAGKIINATEEAKMTIYLDCNATPIATGFPMIGFLVGVVKDHRITNCNRLIVYNKIEQKNGDYLEAELVSILKENKNFDGSSYKPGGLLEGLTNGSGTNIQNINAKMGEFQQKATALGLKIRQLQEEKEKCRATTKGDPSSCNKKYDPLIKKAKEDAKKLQYNLMKNMGVEDMMKPN